MKLINLLPLLLLFAASIGFSKEVFETQEGPVIGQRTQTGVVFRNTPYAKAARWKAPVSPAKRRKPWDGSHLNVKCAQIGGFFSDISDDSELGEPIGSEDCHFLNIWKPIKTSQKPLPVFFWIHGGANKQGTASDPMYDGEKLAEALGAIVVSVNYRLGVFGAFHHDAFKTDDPAESSGNFVTLDLIQALKWVHQNIGALNGDVNNITIAGESAGGINAWGLMQSPLAKGLFHRAFIASGFPNNYSKFDAQKNAEEIIQQALILSGQVNDDYEARRRYARMSSEEIVEFMRSLPTEVLSRLHGGPLPISHIGDGHVLPTDLISTIAMGSYNKVPMFVTSTQREGTLFFLESSMELEHRDLWEILSGQQSADAVKEFIGTTQYYNFEQKSRRLTKSIRHLIDNTLLSAHLGDNNVYRMEWEWKMPDDPWASVLGSGHTFDLPMIFGNTDVDYKSFFGFMSEHLKTREMRALSRRFQNYLKGFVHNSDPNSMTPKGYDEWQKWTPVNRLNYILSSGGGQHQRISESMLMGSLNLFQSLGDLKESSEILKKRKKTSSKKNASTSSEDKSCKKILTKK